MLARRGGVGGTSGSRPPGVRVSLFCPKLRLAVGVGEHGGKCHRERGGTMTGAHLGDRGACRRRSCSATVAPREGARRRGHGDGRHHPRPQRSFFHQILIDVELFSPLPKLCSWTSPTASEPAWPYLELPPLLSTCVSVVQLPRRHHDARGVSFALSYRSACCLSAARHAPRARRTPRSRSCR